MTEKEAPYTAASIAPLIKSPSLRLPVPVVLPPDIHPLPHDVAPYFVYPYTLEPHVLAMEASRQASLAASVAHRDAILKAREDEKQRRKREALRRVAPGFEPSSGLLIPTRKRDSVPPGSLMGQQLSGKKDVMADLVDQLAALDASASGSK